MIETRNTFPVTYKNIQTKKLLEIFFKGPERLKKSVETLSLEEMRENIIWDKWSIAEILIHTVDSEIMGYCRIMQAITQSDRLFAHYNQNIWTESLDYNSYPQEVINARFILFESLRNSLYFILNNVSEDCWEKTGVHQEMGEITLRNLLELYTDHCERHIEQILDRRSRLGKPIEFPLLLKKRLY